MKKEISIFWFRRDLRLTDNHGLFEALKAKYPLLPIFIFDPEILDKLNDKADKRVGFIHHSLSKINNRLKEYGSSIYILNDKVDVAFEKLTSLYEIKEVFTNHDYEPYALNRDSRIFNLLSLKNIPFKTFKDQVIFEK